MSPRPDLGPKPRLGYTASLIERASRAAHGRGRALGVREGSTHARAYLVGGEMVILKHTGADSRSAVHIGAGAHVRPHGGNRLSRALPRRAAIRGRARSAGRRDAQDARGLRRHRSALDRGARPGRGGSSRRRSPKARRCSIGTRGIASARLAGLRPISSKPAGGAIARSCRAQHFPRTDPVVIMLRGRRRALRARPLASLSARHVVVPRRLCRAGRGDRRRRAAGNARGGRHCLRARALFRLAAVALSHLA